MIDAEIEAVYIEINKLSSRISVLESTSQAETFGAVGEAVVFDLDGLQEWVDETLCPMYTELLHPTEYPAWCVDWHLHPLALHLFETLYLSWLEIDDAKSRTVWTDHLFLHTRAVIIDPETGPFKLCARTHHGKGRHEAATTD